MFYCKAVTRNGPICPVPGNDRSSRPLRRPPIITIKGQLPNSQPILATSSSDSVDGASLVNVQSDHPFRLLPITHPKTTGFFTLFPMSPPRITVRGSSQSSTTTNGTDVSDTDIQMISSRPQSPPRITRSIERPSATSAVTDQSVVPGPRSPPRIVMKSKPLRQL
jgi:hypothetical protein